MERQTKRALHSIGQFPRPGSTVLYPSHSPGTPTTEPYSRWLSDVGDVIGSMNNVAAQFSRLLVISGPHDTPMTNEERDITTESSC